MLRWLVGDGPYVVVKPIKLFSISDYDAFKYGLDFAKIIISKVQISDF